MEDKDADRSARAGIQASTRRSAGATRANVFVVSFGAI